jgi:hypothetical protein
VLLDAAAAHAAAARTQVVRAAGAEFEADLSFAALNQVLVTRLELVLSVVAAPAPARRSARRRGDKQGGDHERKTGEAHRDDGGSLRLSGEAAGGGERALLELDALVVLEKAGILGTRSAMVRVEAVRSVLMFGDHDVPLVPWSRRRRGFKPRSWPAFIRRRGGGAARRPAPA